VDDVVWASYTREGTQHRYSVTTNLAMQLVGLGCTSPGTQTMLDNG